MRKQAVETEKGKLVFWPAFYVVIFLVTAILVMATVLWTQNTQTASEKTINDLGEFYLEEITERNTGNITSELEKRTKQMDMALAVLDQEYLRSEENIRQYIGMVQQINGLDMFALVDEDGMVYTADSTFSGISRFSFLSEKITAQEIHIVKSYGTRTMIMIAAPVTKKTSAGISIVSCFTGFNIENIMSAGQLQSAENKTYCRLFSKDGENLLNIEGEYKNEKNLFDILEEGAEFASGYSLEKIKDDWSNGREGYTVYYRKDAGNTYLYYKTVPGTDLILTSLMRESIINQVVEAGTRKMIHSSTIYLGVVIISMLGLFSIIVIIVQNARKNQLENEKFKIVGALSNDYSSIFLMEPLRDQSFCMKVDGQMVAYSEQASRSYWETWKNYVERFVIEEDANRVLDAVSPENLSHKLMDEPEYTLDFQVKLADGLHYYETKFVKIMGEDDRLIVGFRNIDVQKQAEMERQKVL